MSKRRLGGVESGPSRDRSFLRFCNKSSRTVDVMWVNYEGDEVKYKTLAASEAVDVNTFVGHFWTFQDNSTGEELQVNNQKVFNPPLFQIVDGRLSPSSRVLCNINIPGGYALNSFK